MQPKGLYLWLLLEGRAEKEGTYGLSLNQSVQCVLSPITIRYHCPHCLLSLL